MRSLPKRFPRNLLGNLKIEIPPCWLNTVVTQRDIHIGIFSHCHKPKWQFLREIPWHLEESVHSSLYMIVSALLHKHQPLQVMARFNTYNNIHDHLQTIDSSISGWVKTPTTHKSTWVRTTAIGTHQRVTTKSTQANTCHMGYKTSTSRASFNHSLLIC